MKLATILKEIRDESGMSMRDLEKASGVPKSAISNLESGLVTNPCVDTIEKLADAMGYKAELLFTKKGWPTRR